MALVKYACTWYARFLATNSVHQRLHTRINILRGYYAATHGYTTQHTFYIWIMFYNTKIVRGNNLY